MRSALYHCVIKKIELLKYPSNYTSAIITYDESVDSSKGLNWIYEQCPYALSLGRFVADENNLEKFVVFDRHQYAIEVRKGEAWQDTFKFIEN